MNITVEIKNIYGNEMIYPVCEKSKSFAAISGTKTLSRNNICHIKDLGYSITVKQKGL